MASKNILMNTESENKKEWLSAKVECNLCGYFWIAVYHMDSNKLECPNCGNMTIFNVIKIIP